MVNGKVIDCYSKVAAKFGRSKSWVCDVMKDFDEVTGCRLNAKPPGRKRKTTEEEDKG